MESSNSKIDIVSSRVARWNSRELHARAVVFCFAFCGLMTGCIILSAILGGIFTHNRVVHESVSPDGKLKAVAFVRDLGQADGRSIQISIMSADGALQDWQSGNIFVQDGAWAKTRWVDDRKLRIDHSNKGAIYRNEKRYFDLGRQIEIENHESIGFSI